MDKRHFPEALPFLEVVDWLTWRGDHLNKFRFQHLCVAHVRRELAFSKIPSVPSHVIRPEDIVLDGITICEMKYEEQLREHCRKPL